MSRLEKLNKISEYALNQFKEAVQKPMAVHDLDIQRWALEAQDQVSLSPNLFKGSAKWVHEFKQNHQIFSRKMNEFGTQESIIDKDKLKKDPNEFVKKVKYDISLMAEDNIVNSDQSGFDLKMHAGLCLCLKDQKKLKHS